MSAYEDTPDKDQLLAFRRDQATNQRILAERAHALAQPAFFDDELFAEQHQVVHFRSGVSRYGVALEELSEIRTIVAAAPIPCTPRFIQGLVQVHGEITLVIDLVEFLGRRRVEPLPQPLTLLLFQHESFHLGVAVDELFNVSPLNRKNIQTLPANLSRIEHEVCRGINSERILILDGPSLVSHPKLKVGRS